MILAAVAKSFEAIFAPPQKEMVNYTAFKLLAGQVTVLVSVKLSSDQFSKGTWIKFLNSVRATRIPVWPITLKIAHQKMSDLHLVFTKILCGRNFCVW